MKIDEQTFQASIIAQDDDGDYSESGYVACKFPDGTCAIFNYSHCSCYGTWEALTGNDDRELHPAWEGSWKDLKKMAKNKSCLTFPDREVDKENDYDADHLLKVYEQILAFKPQRK